MFRFGSTLSTLERHVGTFSIEALSSVLRPEWIAEALKEAGRASRRIRALPADFVTWVVVAMSLWRGLGIRNLVERLGTGLRHDLRWKNGQAPASNAITKARTRLGVAPLRLLFERLCDEVSRRHQQLHMWNGMPLLALDGTALRMPDSAANRVHFGAPPVGRGRSAFPQVRLVVLMAAVTHVVLAAAMAPFAVGEAPLARTLLEQVKAGSLLLLDRGFLNYRLLWRLQGRGVHFVVRAKSTVRLRRRKGLGPCDSLADILFGATFRRLNPDLPADLRVRVISYRIPGFRQVRVLTSLLDPERFPAADIVARYRDRWEIELGYDEIKTHLGAKFLTLRSASPERVLQETYGLLIAFNVVRALMAQAATLAKVDPRRLSFTDTLERLRHVVTLMAIAPGRALPDLFDSFLTDVSRSLLPPRRQRRYPRAVRVKMSTYPLNRRHHAA